MRGEEVKNKEMIMMKNKESSGKCDENKNVDDEEKNEDVRVTKRNVQRKQNGDEELKRKEDIMIKQ